MDCVHISIFQDRINSIRFEWLGRGILHESFPCSMLADGISSSWNSWERSPDGPALHWSDPHYVSSLTLNLTLPHYTRLQRVVKSLCRFKQDLSMRAWEAGYHRLLLFWMRCGRRKQNVNFFRLYSKWFIWRPCSLYLHWVCLYEVCLHHQTYLLLRKT